MCNQTDWKTYEQNKKNNYNEWTIDTDTQRLTRQQNT